MRTFELFFDNELIDFIVQMTNTYAIETNAVGWVLIGRSDIFCFLRILMLTGYVQLPSFGKRPLMCSYNWYDQPCPETNFVRFLKGF